MRKIILCDLCKGKMKRKIKASLQKYKAKGGRLGSLNPKTKRGLRAYQTRLKEQTALALKKKFEKERKHEKKVLSIIGQSRRQGKTIKEISIYLNRKGIKTKFGNKYHPTSVYRIMRSL